MLTTSRTTPPQYAVGTRVKVADTIRPGHIRTPLFLLGKRGAVAALQGAYPTAERLAYHEVGPPVPLYLVAFEAGEVWGRRVAGPDARFTVYAELSEDWLTPA